MRKNFTLIELLVVISVIAILGGLLLPSLNHAKITARRSACLSNMKSLGTGLVLYMDTYSEWIPTYKRAWFNLLLPMAGGSKKVFICPGSPVVFDPSTGFQQQITIGINASGSNSNKAFYGENTVGPYDWKLTQIQVPSTLFYLTECAPYNNTKIPASNANPGYVNWMDAQARIHNYNCGMKNSLIHYEPANWHDGVNFLFMDTHVEMMPLKKIYQLMLLDKWGDSRPVRIVPGNNKYYY